MFFYLCHETKVLQLVVPQISFFPIVRIVVCAVHEVLRVDLHGRARLLQVLQLLLQLGADLLTDLLMDLFVDPLVDDKLGADSDHGDDGDEGDGVRRALEELLETRVHDVDGEED